jgi:hypothetical protein
MTGPAQSYLLLNKDKDGNAMDGAGTYLPIVPPNAPMKQCRRPYMIARPTRSSRNMPSASVASTNLGVQKGVDGWVDIYFGPNAPAVRKGSFPNQSAYCDAAYWPNAIFHNGHYA